MTEYEMLRTQRDEVPKEFRDRFEKALREAWDYYNSHGRLVDQFEDDYVECAFAKGFLSGCIYRDKAT